MDRYVHTYKLWLYRSLLNLDRFSSFLIYTQSVGLLGRGTSPSQGHYLHTEQHSQKKCTQTSMSLVGFEPTMPAFEWAKISSCLGQRGHCDWRHAHIGSQNTYLLHWATVRGVTAYISAGVLTAHRVNPPDSWTRGKLWGYCRSKQMTGYVMLRVSKFMEEKSGVRSTNS
jgi:hypothetical protein